jgi:DNA-binding IclR family transcriptional regulator
MKTRGDLVVDEPTAQNAGTVRALERGMDVLSQFSVTDQHLTLAELSRRTGLHRATTHRLLKTMENRGFVTWDQERQLYSVGPSLLRILYALDRTAAFAALLQPELDMVSSESGETIGLAVLDGTHVKFIAVRMTSNPFKPSMPTGADFALQETWNANVKVFLASLGPEEQREILAGPVTRYTAYTVHDPVALALQLAKIAKEGVAYDFEERDLGRCAAAVPVRDGQSRIVAALSMVVPTERFGPQQVPVHTKTLLVASEAMTKKMTAHGATYVKT